MIVNDVVFPEYNQEAETFYLKNGWVALEGQVDRTSLIELSNTLDEMQTRYSQEIGCTLESYQSVISQWRNMWQTEVTFKRVLDETLSTLAAKSFSLDNVRLLHDHIISKDAKSGSNGEVPWHQDSMYWPVDRTGMSTWMPFSDVGVTDGCLEVVSGSQLWEAHAPVDFMANEETPIGDAETTLLPISAGSIVLLHSRTWHRSAPTKNISKSRPVHIGLWIPPTTRYYPKNASWHPLNDQVSVPEGKLLNTNEFPLFPLCVSLNNDSISDDQYGNSWVNKHVGVNNPKGMFNAKERAEKDVQKFIGTEGLISDLLSTPDQRVKLSRIITDHVKDETFESVMGTIERLWISASAYDFHRSRNVFNSAYAEWEKLIATSNES